MEKKKKTVSKVRRKGGDLYDDLYDVPKNVTIIDMNICEPNVFQS